MFYFNFEIPKEFTILYFFNLCLVLAVALVLAFALALALALAFALVFSVNWHVFAC